MTPIPIHLLPIPINWFYNPQMLLLKNRIQKKQEVIENDDKNTCLIEYEIWME